MATAWSNKLRGDYRPGREELEAKNWAHPVMSIDYKVRPVSSEATRHY